MTRWTNLLPFLLWWPLVNRKSLRADIIAGLTNAVIVLPQGVAFAIIAGLPPEYGLYTAMVTPVIAALFGSSWHLISGPTTAISIVVFTTVSGVAEPGTTEYINAVLTLTFLAGIYQLVFGLARMGSLVNFVSHTVVVGFTTGAAMLILTSQMKVVLGLDLERGDFVNTWWQIIQSWQVINPTVLAIAAVTAIVAVIVKAINARAPHLLIALLAGSAMTWLLDGEAHGVKLLGALPSYLPPPSLPEFTLDNVRALSTSALAVAILGLIEAVSISRSIAVKSRQRINGNQEFIGQGLSNIVGSFFSAYAGSGSFTRSGVNYDAGARTPLSAIFAAIALALLVLFVAPLTRYLPIPAMGGVIVIVAWGLVNIPEIKKIISAGSHEWSVLLATFSATLFVELEFAVYGGVLLSLLLYLKRTSKPKVLSLAPNPNAPKRRIEDADLLHLPQCPQMKMASIDGSLFFGAVDYVETQFDRLRRANPRQKHLMVLCDGVNFIDLAGAELIEREADNRLKMGGSIALVSLKDKTVADLERFGVLEHIGEENIMDSKTYALRDISARFDLSVCQRCTVKIFRECEFLSQQPEIEQDSKNVKSAADSATK